MSTTSEIDTIAPVAPKLVTGSAFNFLVDPQVTMQTNYGTVVLELNPEQAPVTVANMLAYVDAGFYDGTLFHRVIEGFMIQGGGFADTGIYKTPTYGPIELESDNGLSNLRGTIAMARTSAADSATTQFFINQVDNLFLDYSSAAAPGYAVFGEVVSGLSVIDSIAQVPTATYGSYQNVPVSPVVITAIDQTRSGSSITNAGILQVSDLEAGAQWSYSLDGGSHWQAGSGSSFAIPEGDYAANVIQVRQTDEAGNTSVDVGRLTSALTVDVTAPVASSFSPADAASGASIGSNIIVTFSEAIQRGAGDIILKTAGGITVETYDAAASSNLTVAGQTLIINPADDLDYDTRYFVEFAAGTIRDLAGNGFAGTSSYDFTTGSAPVPLTGTVGDDALTGTTGDDIISGLGGDDSLDGRDGTDTAQYLGDGETYLVLEGDAGSYIVIDLYAGDTDEGRDILTAVEFLKFADGTLPIAGAVSPLQIIDDDPYYWDSMIGLPNGDTVSASEAQLYRTYFGAMMRTPDDSGYAWWLNEIEQGRHTLRSMTAGFIWSEEFLGYVDAPDGNSIPNEVFLTHMYEGVFGRVADEEGFNWWLDQLNAGYKGQETGWPSQAEVLVDMTQSNEYVELTMTGVVDYLYGIAEFA